MAEYKLVYDRDNSREVLMQALEQAEERLIIVCPWLTNKGINQYIIDSFKKLLKYNTCIDIGWGYRGDIIDVNQLDFSEDYLKKIINDWKYNALNKLEDLEKQFSGKFSFKLLGTHEKYLVCDNKFAMLGSHNLLTSSENNQEREVGILTTDIDIIQGLNDRFDNAESLGKPEDVSIDFDYFEREAMGYNAVGGGMSYEQYLDVFGY
ncbi:hypothetical protein PI95_002420 [Hassallia byssoidea VB512170]|uniref:PLD phosphodiesterase domain-containing protein n=1 Tax=Hassallia byssoidea VB512170 TaxID=1304833 RepID=A0A846H4H8_9CYAN|nr:phospholipase D-like domain-containing protein [Hassalia byssoidea]NEU71461.1 hypothetical protein [Hassalia byssoidea VB512170]